MVVYDNLIHFFISRYELRVEELRAKFPESAKMRAEYEVYCKKRLALVQTIRNALQETDLMLEIVSTNPNQPYIFSNSKRRSLMLQ